MQRSLLALAILTAGTASATPFTGNDTRSNAMGNTGVASAESFAASQFNPALLSAYDDDVNFGLQLPSLRFAIDDGYGFIKAANVVEDFENTDANEIQLQFAGGTRSDGTTVQSLQVSIDATATAAEDFDDGVTQAELDAYNEASANLDSKISTIQAELRNLDVAVDNSSDSISTLDDKPLTINGSLGAALAIPRSGIGLALHLTNNTTIGMRATPGPNDLDLIGQAVDDTVGYTEQFDDITELNNTLSDAANTLADTDFGDPDFDTNYDAFLAAQANLEAEATGSNVNYTDSGGAQTAVFDGDNVSNYTSANGFYVNGEFDANAASSFGEDSSVTILGANVIELGISAAREFTYLGQTFAVGVTPKIQSLQIFEDTIELDEAGSVDSSSLSQNTTTAFTGNLDLGIAKNWYNVLNGQVRAGFVIKDLIPQTFESASGRELKMGPKARIGVAHDTRFSTVAMDLDLTENEPLGYGVTTRYIGLGGELDAFNWMKLRAGYRNNLSVDDSHVITTGLGFTPFGVGLDVTGWFSPASFDDWEEIVQDAGFATQFSMNW